MSVLRGCVTGHYVFITRFWELNKTNHQGTFWGMSSLKRIQSNLFFFFSLAYKESAAVIDWWVSATFFSLRTDMQHFGTKAFLQLSLLCEGWERGETVSVFFFFFIFFFFFASSSDMASLGGGVSPSESFHPHQGSRAVTTGIRLITHSPRRLHK